MIQLLATPFLARLFAPKEFGEFAVFQAILIAAMTIVCLRFEMAIPVEKDDRAVDSLMVLGCLSILTISAVLAITAYVWTKYVADGPLHGIEFKVAIGAMAIGLFQLLVFRDLREGRFFQNSVLKLLQASLFVLCSLLIPGAVLIDTFVASYFIVALAILQYRPSLRFRTFADLRTVAIRYREYPLLSMPMALLDSIALAAPLLIIASQYSTSEAGQYSQVQRIACAPLFLFGMAVSQVFFKHASDELKRGSPITPLLRRTVLLLGLVGVGMWLLLATVGEPVFRLLLGDDWRTDRHFLLLIFTPAVIRILVSPISNVFMVTSHIRFGTAWQFVHFLVAVSLYPALSAALGFDDFLATVLLIEVILYTSYLALALYSAYRSDLKARLCVE